MSNEQLDFVGLLNFLAGTSGLGAAGAANAWAGTTNLETVGALNARAGITTPSSMLEFDGVCNALAETSGKSGVEALQSMLSGAGAAASDLLLTQGGHRLLTQGGALKLTQG